MMLDNISTFNVSETFTNNMFALFRFFLLGKYTYRDYEYTFYLAGEEFNADDCFSNNFGRTYCELNGVRYNNVEYTRVLVNEYEQTDSIIPIFTIGILLFFIINVIYKLLFSFREEI